MTNESSITAAFAEAFESYGQDHAVMNYAGVTGPLGRRSHEITLDELDQVMTVNLRGHWR